MKKLIFLILTFFTLSLFSQDSKVVTQTDTIFAKSVYECNHNSLMLEKRDYYLFIGPDSIKYIIQDGKVYTIQNLKDSDNLPYNRNLSESAKTGIVGASLLAFSTSLPILLIVPNIRINRTILSVATGFIAAAGFGCLIDSFSKLNKYSKDKPVKVL